MAGRNERLFADWRQRSKQEGALQVQVQVVQYLGLVKSSAPVA